MALPAVLLMSIKKAAKTALIKKTINFVMKKDANKLDFAMSFIPGLSGKAIRQLRRYQKVCKASAMKVAFHEGMIKSARTVKELAYHQAKLITAQELKSKWVKKELKKAFMKRIPGRKLAMNIEDLGKAMYDHKSWVQIGKKFGTVMSNFGIGEVSRIFGTLDKASSFKLTANQWWRSISINHSAEHPQVNSRGGAKMKYARRYKDRYQEQLFDREFYFWVNSPTDGNFDKNIHSYDPIVKEYNLPIVGWGGKQLQYYSFYNAMDLDRVINLICNISVDFGKVVYNDIRTDNSYYFKKNKK